MPLKPKAPEPEKDNSELLTLLHELKTKFIVGHPTRDKIERAIKLVM